MRRRAAQLVARGAQAASSGGPSADAALAASTSPRCCAATDVVSTSLRRRAGAALPASLAPLAAALPELSPAALPLAQGASFTSCRGFAAAAASGGRRGGGAGPEAAAAAAEVMEADEAARRVMADPMSRLLASQGMPVGLSLRTPVTRTGDARGPPADEDPSAPPRAEPGYQMEALQDMLDATLASAARTAGGGAAGGSSSTSSSSSSGGGGSGGGGVGGGDSNPYGEGFTAGVQGVGLPGLGDAWGTTRESPAEIARRIVEANTRGGPAGALADPDSDAEGDEDEDEEGEELTAASALSPSEQKYSSLEAMSAEIKKLDEVFELLASVPWLDEDVLSEKELRGVAQVGLLGTLEEVGFRIRHQVQRIWAGERGAELAEGAGLEFRDQAALLAVLYHTATIEEKHGPPPRGFLPPPPPPLPEGAVEPVHERVGEVQGLAALAALAGRGGGGGGGGGGSGGGKGRA